MQEMLSYINSEGYRKSATFPVRNDALHKHIIIMHKPERYAVDSIKINMNIMYAQKHDTTKMHSPLSKMEVAELHLHWLVATI